METRISIETSVSRYDVDLHTKEYCEQVIREQFQEQLMNLIYSPRYLKRKESKDHEGSLTVSFELEVKRLSDWDLAR